LVIILLLIVAVVVLVYLWPRLGGGGSRRTAAEPAGRPPLPRPDDPDQVDEAAEVQQATGGEVLPGDAISVTVDDPSRWGIGSFELDLSIAAVSRAEIRDRTGLFSFLVYWMPAGQEAAVMSVEGDVLALGEAFIGRQVTDEALIATLRWCRDHYLAGEHDAVDFDLSEHGLGTWTAFAAREGGSLRIERGTAPLLPASAGGAGLPYRDFTLYQGDRSGPERLRLVEIGGYQYLFQGEVTPLRAVTFLRRGRSPGRA
jgi:hypothetical protein